MIESNDVFGLLKVVYVIYVGIVFSMVGMYVFGLTAKTKVRPGIKVPFYGWVAILVFFGVGIHIMTFHKIPWVKWDLSRNTMKVDKEFNIAIADYEYQIPGEQLVIERGETVRFNLESRDYTYGFGLFREDGTMVFQMQVVPGHSNDIVWKFDKPASYTIRSTEYSGPKGANLFATNAVIVSSEPAVAQIDKDQSL